MKADQAQGLRNRRDRVVAPARMVAFVSGKGGVGKTHLAVSAALAAAGLGARVLLVDGDLGLANVDVLLGLPAGAGSRELLEGRARLDEVLHRGPRGVHILPAASARAELAALPRTEIARLAALLRRAAARFDLVLLDLGAGIGPVVLQLAALCGRAVVVATPEPTSLADAYAVVKLLHGQGRGDGPELELVVNTAGSELEALETHDHLDRLARRFLGRGLRYRGHVPRDPRVPRAVALQRAVVEAAPTSPAARAIVRLAADLLQAVKGAGRFPEEDPGENTVRARDSRSARAPACARAPGRPGPWRRDSRAS